MCISNCPILDFIITHPESWQNDLETKNIRVKQQGDLAILNYRPGADFNDEIVREARGIIIDIKNLSVVCYPFTKFGNYYESYADDIDWSTAHIQEKIDGSIVKLYYYNGDWHWSTNSCIDAVDATIQGSTRSFLDIIYSAANYNDVCSLFDKFDINKTYIFELVSPETKVVIDYQYPYLYHIGTRGNLTSYEYDSDWGIERPRVYNIDDANLEKVIQKAINLNNEEVGVQHEGFVVVDGNFHRVKIKNPEYLQLHHNISRSILTKRDAIQIIRDNDEEVIHSIGLKPQLDVTFKFYQWQYAKFCYELDEYIHLKRGIYMNICKGDRKLFAQNVIEDKFKTFAFKAIDDMMATTDQIINNVPLSLILKFIEDYSE